MDIGYLGTGTLGSGTLSGRWKELWSLDLARDLDLSHWFGVDSETDDSSLLLQLFRAASLTFDQI